MNTPLWLDIFFIAICLCTLTLFHKANNGIWKVTLLVVSWSIIQSMLAYLGFYHDMSQMPPRFLLVLIPNALVIIYAFLPAQRAILQQRNQVYSTFTHSIRVAVEVTLYFLFVYNAVPELMTFEGRNFDILTGLTAPVVGYLLVRKKIGRTGLLTWNVAGLCLVLFILANGILSTELPIQQFAFDQPNVAVQYFPYVLLPATIVPIVIYLHLSDIYLLTKTTA